MIMENIRAGEEQKLSHGRVYGILSELKLLHSIAVSRGAVKRGPVIIDFPSS